MAGRSPRQKGNRVERKLVSLLNEAGLPSIRVPLSGGGSIHGDIKIGPRREWSAEVKARKDGAGWTTLERWKAGNEFLFLVRDREAPLAVMDWDVFVALLKCHYHCEAGLE